MAFENGLKRSLVALVAIPLVLATCYLGGYFFFVFVLGVATLAFHEFVAIGKAKRAFPSLVGGYLSILAIFINAFHPFIEIGNLFMFIIILTLTIELFRNKESAILNNAVALLGIFYTGYLTSFLIKIRELYNYSDFVYLNGGYFIIALLIGIWFCDSAAYFFGSAFGKHKLFPRVSPKKSWEGAIAGFIFTIIAFAFSKVMFLELLTWQNVFVLGAIVGISGQVGDLIESLIKRDAKIKDSSSLIPGHGGVLDRFDSIIFSAPLVYFYIANYIV